MSIAGIMHRAQGESARDQIRNFVLDNTQSFYGQYAYDIDPKSLGQFGFPSRGAQQQVSEGHRAAANTKPASSSAVDRAAAVFKTPGAREVEWKSVSDADRNWLVYASEGGLLEGKPARSKSVIAKDGQSPRLREPGWADDMSLLSMTAADTRLDQKERERARNELIRIRDLTDSENVDAAQYAQWLLNN